MTEFTFVKRRVQHYYWNIEADTLEEACRKWNDLQEDIPEAPYDLEAADGIDTKEDDLIEVVKDCGPTETVYDMDQVRKAMPD
jgi:hypothetical protein